jgi:hypothetical protein
MTRVHKTSVVTKRVYKNQMDQSRRTYKVFQLQTTTRIFILNFEIGSGLDRLGIEAVFVIPRHLWPDICREYAPGWEQDILVTIPTEDRVASALQTIPRLEALTIGERFQLPYVNLSGSLPILV